MQVSQKEAIAFLESKAEWVEQGRQKIAKKIETPPIEMPYSTRRHTLRLNPASTNRVSARVANGLIVVSYPMEAHYTEKEVQMVAKKGIEAAWKIEALEILPQRVTEIAAKLGLHYRNVSVRNTRSRWGSCSSLGDISLSIHLMRLPDHLVDYIIIHELCHTVHRNHGPNFHALLDSLTNGQHRALNKEMKDYHTR